MTTLTLPDRLTNVLQMEATRAGKPVAILVEEWLRQQYATLQRQRLAEQTKRFWNNYDTLYAAYPNQVVAFYNDQVLDHDPDMRTLAIRIRAAHGDLPIVIAQMTNPPIRAYRAISVRTPRPTT